MILSGGMPLSIVHRRSLLPRDAVEFMVRQVKDRRRAQGKALLALRKSRNWSQEDAAHEVGVSVSTWGDWERGKHDPYDKHWRAIEETFGVDIADIRGSPPAALFAVGASSGDASQLDRIEAAIKDLSDQVEMLRIATEAHIEEAQELVPALVARVPSRTYKEARKAGRPVSEPTT
jgi:putative transcriptional regulator